MHNHFLKYEQDFESWVNSDFPGTNPLTQDFLIHLQNMEKRKLWRHQMIGIQRVIYAYELSQMKNILLNIVTGGGKTAIIGAIMAWLKSCHKIDKFVVLSPNLIVRDRLEEDFRDSKIFYDFDFFPKGTEHLKNDLSLHVLGDNDVAGIKDAGIILGNIHQLYQSNTGGKINLNSILRFSNIIAVFNDEAHNTPAPEYDSTLHILSQKCKFRLDTTATPDRADGKTPDSKMIYEFKIADAEATTPPIIKRIYVYQPVIKWIQLTYTNKVTGEKRTVDEMDEEFEKIEKGLTSTQWVTDREPMYKQMQIALDRLKEQERRALAIDIGNDNYTPILFVVAICKIDAGEAQAMLVKELNIPTLLVTEDSEADDRTLAGLIGKKGKNLEEAEFRLAKKLNDKSKANQLAQKASTYKAIVSVLMLREGWDVPPVSVILLLRKFSSPVYGQQVIGRGLRLNIREKDAQELVAVIDHERLNHQWLWDLLGAIVKRDVELGQDFTEEDTPPKRKEQLMVQPENLIEIPPIKTGIDEDKIDLEDLENITNDYNDYPHWRQIIDEFEYIKNIEISDIEIAGIKGKNIFDNSKFYQEYVIDNEANKHENTEKPERAELIEIFKSSIRDIASALLAEEGIGSHELGFLYGIILDHVKSKFFFGKPLMEATPEEFNFAYRAKTKIYHNFKDISGLVTSIIKFR
ncbi:MAG: ResIII protein [Ignavibacteria bacterium]|nr:ResIII protein [Ignavibacteria bacterium]